MSNNRSNDRATKRRHAPTSRLARPARGGAAPIARPAARRGNAVMEAALVLPVLLALSMGMVEFGYFFYAKHTIQAAARDGARNAILPTTTHTAAVTSIRNTMDASNFTNQSSYTISFINPSNNATISDVGAITRGTAVKVTVTANYGSIGLRPLGVIAANKPVVGVTTMIKE